MLLGLAERSHDAMGRDGFIGNCVLIEEQDVQLPEHIRALNQHFEDWSDYYEEVFKQLRHTGQIGFLKPAMDAPEKLQRPIESAEIQAFSLAHGDSWSDGVKLLRRAALACNDNLAGIIFWPVETQTHPALTEDIVGSLEGDRKKRDAQKAARWDHEAELRRSIRQTEVLQFSERHSELVRHSEFTDARLDKFHRRTPYLRPRPKDIDVAYEDYLLSLIEFALQRSQSAAPESDGHKATVQRSASLSENLSLFESRDTLPLGMRDFVEQIPWPGLAIGAGIAAVVAILVILGFWALV